MPCTLLPLRIRKEAYFISTASGGNVRLKRGELDFPAEWFAQCFPAVKAQNIRLHGTVIDIQKVSGLPVKKR